MIHPYSPTESDELELLTGDYVYLSPESLTNSADGWLEGTSWLTGLTGFIPASYTERTAESDAWTLHKKVALNHLTGETKNSNMSAKEGSVGNENSVKNSETEEITGISSNPDFSLPNPGYAKENVYENLVEAKNTSEVEEENVRIEFNLFSFVITLFFFSRQVEVSSSCVTANVSTSHSAAGCRIASTMPEITYKKI